MQYIFQSHLHNLRYSHKLISFFSQSSISQTQNSPINLGYLKSQNKALFLKSRQRKALTSLNNIAYILQQELKSGITVKVKLIIWWQFFSFFLIACNVISPWECLLDLSSLTISTIQFLDIPFIPLRNFSFFIVICFPLLSYISGIQFHFSQMATELTNITLVAQEWCSL